MTEQGMVLLIVMALAYLHAEIGGMLAERRHQADTERRKAIVREIARRLGYSVGAA